MVTVGEVMTSVVLKGILAVFEWMKYIFTAFDAWKWIFGAFCICTVYRFLLAPLLGGRVIDNNDISIRNSQSDDLDVDIPYLRDPNQQMIDLKGDLDG